MIRLLLLVVPLLELAGLILLGQAIGVGYTLLWVLVSGILGVGIIQRQGWGMLQRLQLQMARNGSPFAVLKSGMWGVLAGVLLVFPGILTDLLAVPALLMALTHRRASREGEADGPRVYRNGDHDVIEGEWQAQDESRDRKPLDRQ
ncbi:FxsA family protein [Pseudomonas sp.]|uniref:FxsA family protein n=1 Tax=Pseudomonas sp. TaxID=306 RepID=UPI00272D285C|nr:FxsA family protein [Pseudomonas sp.]